MDVLRTDKTDTLTEGVVQLDAALDLQGKPLSRKDERDLVLAGGVVPFWYC